MFSTTIQAGDVFVHRTAGGGGWGDPAERDPERIAEDIADGKVTGVGSTEPAESAGGGLAGAGAGTAA
jgi:N-methylhydantoinase B